MSNFAQQIKGEISRIARKEVRAETQALKKASTQYRSEIASLKRHIAGMEASIKKLSQGKSATAAEPEEGGEFPSLRFRVAGFAALRKKLGLSAAEMGKLIGVSAQVQLHEHRVPGRGGGVSQVVRRNVRLAARPIGEALDCLGGQGIRQLPEDLT